MAFTDRLHNRGSISTGYNIDNSLKLEADNAEYLERGSGSIGTPTSDQKATISLWVKRTELQPSGNHICLIGYATNTMILGFNNNRLSAHFSHPAGTNLKSSAVFRDTSAWYHLVWAFDTTQATASNRAKMYVNGVQITDFDTATWPSQNGGVGLWEVNMGHYIGWSDAQCQSGYHAEIYLIDGQQLAPTDFGEFDTDTGIWKPKEYTGTFGNEGYYLNFSNSADLKEDSSGNSNNFTAAYNITSVDQATDTPTNNFCTLTSSANFYWEPKSENATNGGTTVSDSNVTNNWTGTMATTPLFTGKWYWEVYMFQPSEQMCGIHDFSGNVGSTTGTPHPYQLGNSWTVYGGGANWIKSLNGTDTTGTSETAFSNNTIVGVALDLDNHLLTFYENGGSAGTNLTNIDISSLTNVYPGPWMPFVGVYRNKLQTNFGGFPGFTISSGNTDENGYGNFEYAPPSGFLAICTKNLAGS